MGADVSLPVVLESLRAQIAHHREQESFHAERESFHSERRASHAGELEQLTRHLEALESAFSGAVKLASRELPTPLRPAENVAERRILIGKAVIKVIESKDAREPFGPAGIAAEVNQRFGGRLKRPADRRKVSAILRRFAKRRAIFISRKGRSHRAAIYVRSLPPD